MRDVRQFFKTRFLRKKKKKKDLGSFTIPCLICDLDNEKALADLGTRINVMHTPFSKG